MTNCTIEGCPNTINCRGYCIKHYARWRRHGGNPLGGKKHLTWDYVSEEIEWFLQCGASPYEISQALGATAARIARLCYSHDRDEWGSMFQRESTRAA